MSVGRGLGRESRRDLRSWARANSCAAFGPGKLPAARITDLGGDECVEAGFEAREERVVAVRT